MKPLKTFEVNMGYFKKIQFGMRKTCLNMAQPLDGKKKKIDKFDYRIEKFSVGQRSTTCKVRKQGKIFIT